MEKIKTLRGDKEHGSREEKIFNFFERVYCGDDVLKEKTGIKKIETRGKSTKGKSTNRNTRDVTYVFPRIPTKEELIVEVETSERWRYYRDGNYDRYKSMIKEINQSIV